MKKSYLLLSHIRIHDANAMSCAYAAGFPSVTSFLGFVHAFERSLDGLCMFPRTGIIVHQAAMQAWHRTYDWELIQPAVPGDDGKRPAIIETARIHLDISLLLTCDGMTAENDDIIAKRAKGFLLRHPVAGGNVECVDDVLPIYQEQDVLRRIMPGYALVSRLDLMQPVAGDTRDAMDRMLDTLAIQHKRISDADDPIVWQSSRNQPGWIIPIAVGYHALSPAGHVLHQRDPDTPHCFAEPIMTLGEFRMPFHFQAIDEMMWEYRYDEKRRNYLCVQTKDAQTTEEES